MALAGHDTAYLVFNDTTTATSYSGTLNGVVAGELVVVVLSMDGNNNSQTPSGYTVTLGSDTLTYRAGNSTTLAEGFSAVFSGVASASGNQTLSVTTTNSLRAMAAHAFRITGFNATTPHPSSGQNHPSASVTTLTSPNGVTTSANGNAIIGGISIHGGDITNLAVAAADGSTVGRTGTSAFNDCSWGVAWDRTPTAASVTFAWTWTTSDRPGAAWVEVAEATGSGSQTITGVAFSSADTFGAGTVTAAATIAGAAFGSADAFGAGAASARFAIAGATASGPDSFGAGTISAGYTITGGAFAAPDTFGAGTIAAGGTIIGAAWSSPDAFGAGVVSQPSGAQTITGALFSAADTFGTGSVSTARTIGGAAFGSADTFGAGTVTVRFVIGGAAVSGPDSFGAGAVTAVRIITGAAFSAADTFGAGVILAPGQVRDIIMASVRPPGFRALGGQGSIRAIGGGG